MTDNATIFFSIWRNIYIKQNIFNHIKLYNTIKHIADEPVFNNLKSFIKFKQQFKYYSYFKRIKIKILDTCFDKCELIIFSIDLEIFNEMVVVDPEHYYEDYQDHNGYNHELLPPQQGYNSNYLYQILNYFNQSIIGLYFLNSKHQLMGNDDDDDENSILYNSMILKFKSDLVSTFKIPSSVLELHFDSVNVNDLSVGSLPCNLQSLSFGNSFNQPINDGVLSNCNKLLNLEFGTCFYNDIQQLPNSLLNLSISSDHLIDFKLPNNITQLKFQIITGKIEPNWIPSSCKSLYLGEFYNHSFGGPSNSWFSYFYNIFHSNHTRRTEQQYSYILPLDSKLEYLHLGKRFHQKLNIGQLSMCKYLTTIILSCYNSTIEIGTFPNSCLHLKFENEFNNGGQKLIKNCLPPNLQTLDLGLSFNQEIDCQVLPSSLEQLKLGMHFNKPIPKGVLPIGLKKLHLFFSSQIKSLKGINITNTDVQLTCSSFPLFQSNNKSVFKSITHIQCLSGGSKIRLKYPLPKHLKSLDISKCELDSPFDFSKLPISITSISFPMNFNSLLNGSLKSKTNLKEVTFRDGYNCCILTDNELPSSIKQLKIGDSIFNFQHSQDSLDNNLFPHLSFYYTPCKIIPFQFSDPFVNNFQFNNHLNSNLTDLYNLINIK